MTRSCFGFAIGILLCLTVSLAHGQARGKAGAKGGGERPGGERASEGPGAGRAGAGKAPGGNWGEPKPHFGSENNKAPGAAGLERNKPGQPSGAEGAAAARGISNRNAPPSGAEGAAAGVAASNRNAPPSGAEGAAAGAAVANRNAPAATGAQGAAAGAAVANRNQPVASGAAGAAAGYASVRNSFNRQDMYGAAWYGTHTAAWTPTGWAAGAVWTPTAWSGLANHFGFGNGPPVSYNYGANVTCVDGNVLVDGQTIGTAADFSQQASDLAQAGATAKSADTDKWLPLGVFALVKNEQQHPQLILQLAINQQGNLRGNYTDETTDNTLPIQGGVDLKSQRAAWTVGNNSSCVMEAGLSNLTQSEAPALLHKNGQTERWTLVRLEPPK